MQKEGEELVEVNCMLPFGPARFMSKGGLQGPVCGTWWVQSPYSEDIIYLIDANNHGIAVSKKALDALPQNVRTVRSPAHDNVYPMPTRQRKVV
jgi:hypothetical protein